MHAYDQTGYGISDCWTKCIADEDGAADDGVGQNSPSSLDSARQHKRARRRRTTDAAGQPVAEAAVAMKAQAEAQATAASAQATAASAQELYYWTKTADAMEVPVPAGIKEMVADQLRKMMGRMQQQHQQDPRERSSGSANITHTPSPLSSSRSRHGRELSASSGSASSGTGHAGTVDLLSDDGDDDDDDGDDGFAQAAASARKAQLDRLRQPYEAGQRRQQVGSGGSGGGGGGGGSLAVAPPVASNGINSGTSPSKRGSSSSSSSSSESDGDGDRDGDGGRVAKGATTAAAAAAAAANRRTSQRQVTRRSPCLPGTRCSRDRPCFCSGRKAVPRSSTAPAPPAWQGRQDSAPRGKAPVWRSSWPPGVARMWSCSVHEQSAHPSRRRQPRTARQKGASAGCRAHARVGPRST